jgi:hypothetical protein
MPAAIVASLVECRISESLMSQFNSSTYDVQRPTGQCAITGRALVPHEHYIATLVEDGDNLKRLDVCNEAWESGQRPEHLFSYWKAVVPEPNAKKKLFVDDTVLMELIKRLADADQPQRIGFRFVLMLILMRKKLLRYDKTEKVTVTGENNEPLQQEWWLLTPKLDVTKGPLSKWDESSPLRVLDPRLDESSIRQITDQLSEILQAEL